jgi:hypothetical protein
MAEIVVGSMITTYHLYRTLGMQEEGINEDQGRPCHLNHVGLVANIFPFYSSLLNNC